MPRFAANLSFLYQDLPFPDRFFRAAEDGFGAVEYVSPYEFDKSEVANVFRLAGIEQAMFNMPAGNWAGGERGIGCLPDRVEEFRSGVDKTIEYARALNCKTVNCLAGLRRCRNHPLQQAWHCLCHRRGLAGDRYELDFAGGGVLPIQIGSSVDQFLRVERVPLLHRGLS